MVSTEVKGKKSTSKGKPASKTKNAKSAPPPLKVRQIKVLSIDTSGIGEIGVMCC